MSCRRPDGQGPKNRAPLARSGLAANCTADQIVMAGQSGGKSEDEKRIAHRLSRVPDSVQNLSRQSGLVLWQKTSVMRGDRVGRILDRIAGLFI